MDKKFLNVGKIVNTHGLRGEVKVWPHTDFPETRFAPGSKLYLEDKITEAMLPLEVAAARAHKNVYLIKFKQFNHINEVERLKGSLLKIADDQFMELEEHEFYYHDIIGCDVVDENGEYLGRIKEILHPGANDVWVCQRPKGKDLLIPYIEDVVLEVNVQAKKITIQLLEGML